jgi:hypothetical protein
VFCVVSSFLAGVLSGGTKKPVTRLITALRSTQRYKNMLRYLSVSIALSYPMVVDIVTQDIATPV